MSKNCKKTTRVLSSILIFAILIFSMSQAPIITNASGVTSVTGLECVAETPTVYAVRISFDQTITDTQMFVSSYPQVMDYIKINGQTLTQLNTTYPNPLAIYYIEIYQNYITVNVNSTILDASYRNVGTSIFEIMPGLTSPLSFVTTDIFKYVRSGTSTFDHVSTAATNVQCLIDTASSYVLEVTFDKDIALGAANVDNTSLINDNIKVNGDTLTDINTKCPGLFVANYVGCWGPTKNNVMQINFDKTKMTSISSVVCYYDAGNTYALNVKFDKSISSTAVDGVNYPSIMNNMKLNGKTFTELNTLYPGSILGIWINCSGDNTLMQPNFDKSLLPADFISSGTSVIEVMPGLTFPNGNFDSANQKYVRNGALNFIDISTDFNVGTMRDSIEILPGLKAPNGNYVIDNRKFSRVTGTDFSLSTINVSASAGWDVYQAPAGDTYGYEIGPSLIINADNSIDYWAATMGNTASGEINQYTDNGNNVAVQMSASSTKAAERFTARWAFGAIEVFTASYGNNLGNLTLKLYAWNTNYTTTIGGTALAARTFKNFTDNSYLTLDMGTQQPGDYMWVLSSPTENVGVYKSPNSSYVGNVTYFNGSIVTGDYVFKIVDSVEHFTGGTPTAVALTGTNTAAQKFTSKNDFYAISIKAPSYGNNVGNLTVKVYKWNTNYSTTIAGTVIGQNTFTNFFDNQHLMLYLGVQTVGDYLWVASSPTESVGLWKNVGSTYTGNVNYLNGGVVSGDYCSRVYEYAWDVIRYKHSTDGGHTWTPETVVLKPTPGSKDAFSTCDPGVVKIGSYYYMGYTSTDNYAGVNNQVFVSRSTSPTGPFEKWSGSGWGGSPQPLIAYTGASNKFGAGEPSFVVKDNTIYIYYTLIDETGSYTKVATASATNANWPQSVQQQGTAITKYGSMNSFDVKYVDAYNKFIAVSFGNATYLSAYLTIYESTDGITFHPAKTNIVTANLQEKGHNQGISGDSSGHLDLTKNNFIAYAYGTTATWGHWNTFLNPITLSNG